MALNSKSSILTNFLTPIEIGKSSSARQGLQRLMILRAVVSIGSLFGLLIFQNISGTFLALELIIWLVLIIVLSIGLGYWRLISSDFISNTELFCHLLIDAAVLITVLLNSGGASNPLISYLLVLLAVTATLLPRAYVNSFALISIFAYSSFLFLDLQTEAGLHESGEAHNMQQHLVGMWAIFLVSAILIAQLITQMTSAIKVRELNLAKARETELRNEQLVAIGTLAAGTAHALGTPLSTMAVLLTDLDKLNAEQLKTSEIKEDISLLKQQVVRCKNSLTQLTDYYNKDNPETEENMLISEFVDDIKDYIVNINPKAPVKFLVNCRQETKVASSLSFRHAVINIIENGVKAANKQIEIEFKTTNENPSQLEISVTDDGPGIPTKVMENLGEPFISERNESMGLGIFLANAAITRLGGRIEMFNLKVGGALTLIKIPIPG